MKQEHAASREMSVQYLYMKQGILIEVSAKTIHAFCIRINLIFISALALEKIKVAKGFSSYLQKCVFLNYNSVPLI